MSERVRVGPEADLSPGDRTVVTLDDRSIGVFNVDGELYALENRCPHVGGPVCTGTVQGTLVGEWSTSGERVKERFTDQPAIACPWHGWEFDLETGRHIGDDSIAVPTYEVVVEDGDVYLEI